MILFIFSQITLGCSIEIKAVILPFRNLEHYCKVYFYS